MVQKFGVGATFTLPSKAVAQEIFTDAMPVYATYINNWLSGIPDRRNVPCYFRWRGTDPGALLGPSLRSAVQNNDRARAWYEIRYNSNGGASASNGIAKRRYMESENFGLYDDASSVTVDEAKNVFQMYAHHRQRIEPTISSMAAWWRWRIRITTTRAGTSTSI